MYSEFESGVPPVTDASILPSPALLQLTFTGVLLADNTAGSVIIALVVVIHPLASETVNIYKPGANPLISSEVEL